MTNGGGALTKTYLTTRVIFSYGVYLAQFTDNKKSIMARSREREREWKRGWRVGLGQEEVGGRDQQGRTLGWEHG